MPIYEFECRACGNRFERVCRLSEDNSAVECPECGARRPRKLPSTFAAGAACRAPGGSGFG